MTTGGWDCARKTRLATDGAHLPIGQNCRYSGSPFESTSSVDLSIAVSCNPRPTRKNELIMVLIGEIPRAVRLLIVFLAPDDGSS